MRIRTNRSGGFTLIELMIVIAIIAIIAAIAIPSLLQARLSANETAAVGALKTISSTEAVFRNKEMPAPATQQFLITAGYPNTPGNAIYCQVDDLVLSGLIDPAFTITPGGLPGQGFAYQKMGYWFYAEPSDPNPDTLWGAECWPTVYDLTGTRLFAIDGQGTIWYAPDGGGANFLFTNANAPPFDCSVVSIPPGLQAPIGK